MQKWTTIARQLAINLGLLAVMWILDNLGLLPRLYPQIVDGVVKASPSGASAGILLALVTVGWAIVIELQKSLAPKHAAPKVSAGD